LGTTLFAAGHLSIQNRIMEIPSLQSIGEKALPSFSDQIASGVIETSGAAIPSLKAQLESFGAPAETVTAITDSARIGFTDGVKATGWAGAILLLIGLGSTFSLRRSKSEQR